MKGDAIVLSVVAMTCGLAALAGWLHRHSGAIIAAVFAPLVILLNPNVLYLQSTPMTEPLLIGLSLLAVAAVDAWMATPDRRHARLASLVLAALVLTRYEGWFITTALVLVGSVAMRQLGWRRAFAPPTSGATTAPRRSPTR